MRLNRSFSMIVALNRNVSWGTTATWRSQLDRTFMDYHVRHDVGR
jgi:hypothetical protein